MVLNDNNSHIGIELAGSKPTYIGHDENRMANQIQFIGQ